MPATFTLVKRGYNPIEVDNYIKNLEAQINEYKEKASAINNAIINAQLAADNIIKDATLKTEKILSSAEKDAQTMKLNAINQVKSMKTNIAEQIKTVEAFNKDYTALITKYLQPVNSSEISPLIQKMNDVNKLIDSFGETVSKAETSPEALTPTENSIPIKVEPIEDVPDLTPVSPIAAAGVSISEASQNAKAGFENSAQKNTFSKQNIGAAPKVAPIKGAESKLNKPLQPTPAGVGLNKTMPEAYNPFNKKPASVNPFAKNKSNESKIENELFTAAASDSSSAFDNEFSVINENTDYNSLMGEAGSGSQIPSSNTSQSTFKPGVYKTNEIFNDYSQQGSMSDSFSNTMLSKSELEELMPTPKNRK